MNHQEQFTRCWTEAQPKLAGYINALVPDFQEAEDLLQDVAVILLRKFPEYDPHRPFIAWAIGFTRREVLIHYRNSCNVGAEQGMKISSYVLDNFLLPLHGHEHHHDDNGDD